MGHPRLGYAGGTRWSAKPVRLDAIALVGWECRDRILKLKRDCNSRSLRHHGRDASKRPARQVCRFIFVIVIGRMVGMAGYIAVVCVHMSRHLAMNVDRTAQCFGRLRHETGSRHRLSCSAHRRLLKKSRHRQKHQASGDLADMCSAHDHAGLVKYNSGDNKAWGTLSRTAGCSRWHG